MGLDSPLDVMIDELVERYCVTATHDTLICDFHQLVQEHNEKIREFTGRIEKIFKKLRKQIPERYRDKTLLKDHLFHGMHQHLKRFSSLPVYTSCCKLFRIVTSSICSGGRS